MKTLDLIKKMDPSLNYELNEAFGEVTLTILKEQLIPFLTFFKKHSYDVLMDLTAVDYIGPIYKTKVIYWLHNMSHFERIRLAVFIDREGSIPSIVTHFPGADWYERELFDMFGIYFEGHPELKRILMPDDWEGHPMLKDYALTEVPVEFKQGVTPKVPSQIIPDIK